MFHDFRFCTLDWELSTAFGSQGVISSARRSAKAEVRGANPRESATFKALVPQQLQGGFRKPVFVGASPTRGPIYQGRDVTAASRPVKAFVPVRIRLVTPIGRVQTLRWAEDDRLSSN